MFRQFESAKRKLSQDCVIRAIMVATGKDWVTIFRELAPICEKLLDVPNSDAVYKKYFKKNGWEPGVVEKYEDDYGDMRLPTIEEFAKTHKNGTYIITINGHMVCIKDGDWYDKWDCRHYKVRKYWTVTTEFDDSGLFKKK